MNIPSCSLPVWKNLYDAAIAFRDIACWEWMSDSDIFGVQNPETGEVGYCCVLGQLGEVFGLAVYLGSEGLEQHRKIQSGKIHAGSPEFAYSQSCLTAWFGDRNDLDQADVKVVRELGLKFRGSNVWPQFRSLQPGYLPWYLTESEAKYLAVSVEQAREVALCLDKDPNWLSAPGKNHYLVRVPVDRDGGWSWESRWLNPAPMAKSKVRSYPLDEVRLRWIKNTGERRQGIWEVGAFYMPTPVEGEERPYFPYSILCADHDSGSILGTALAEPSDWETEFSSCILDCIEEHDLLPSALWVRKEELRELFEPLASRLDIEVQLIRKLPAIDRARRAMLKYFKNRR
ncbi:MAG: hypothetical protein HY694_09765 [Deltaproteobacteria bacterium]|nr:hypothetical protein [Deltaproteobacteria bacterium]